MTKAQKTRQRGFSMIEMMLVVLILSIVMASVFSQIDQAQKRYRTEEVNMDLMQESRQFVEQFTRDLHQTGYPSQYLYQTVPATSSTQRAVGIWYISETSIAMEGDVDGDGAIDSVRYDYSDTGTGCPCIRRSQQNKTAAEPWNQANPVYYSQLENIAEIDDGAGGTKPIFIATDDKGANIDLSTALQMKSGGTDLTKIQSIKQVTVNFTVQGTGFEPGTQRRLQISMTGSARITNPQ